MNYHFKAKMVYYNGKEGIYHNGNELIINMNCVVRFQKTDVTNLKKADDVGIIFDVVTTTDHTEYSLRVTSQYLERLMEHTE